MKVLLLDNYDSFTYNLLHSLQENTGVSIDVYRNDEISVEAVAYYDAIVLSPGPGLPSESGILKELIQTYAATKPILGVCLGLQAIVEVFGGVLENLETVFHGVSSPVVVLKEAGMLFKEIPQNFEAARYHSWVASKTNFPEILEITAVDTAGTIMAIQHKVYPIAAVQFHPESILTPVGNKLIQNFIESIA